MRDQGLVTQLFLQGERVFAAGSEATFTPSAEIGLRHDGGDAYSGTGVEIGAGATYTSGGLSIEGRVRALWRTGPPATRSGASAAPSG